MNDVVVSCRNEQCASPAPRTTVAPIAIAPGIVGMPDLRCASCGWPLWRHHDEPDVDDSGHPPGGCGHDPLRSLDKISGVGEVCLECDTTWEPVPDPLDGPISLVRRREEWRP